MLHLNVDRRPCRWGVHGRRETIYMSFPAHGRATGQQHMVEGRESMHAPPIGGLNWLTSLTSSGPSKPCSCLILED